MKIKPVSRLFQRDTMTIYYLLPFEVTICLSSHMQNVEKSARFFQTEECLYNYGQIMAELVE